MRKGLFGIVTIAVSWCDMVSFVLPYGIFHNAKKAVWDGKGGDVNVWVMVNVWWPDVCVFAVMPLAFAL